MINYDYWKTNSIEQHEQFLRDLIKQGLSNAEMLKRISARFGEDTPEFQAEEQLEGEINSRISTKLRDKLSVEQYFERREQIRNAFLNAGEVAEKKAEEEESRITGKCPKCGAKCRSKGSEWFCSKCNRRFRKRIA